MNHPSQPRAAAFAKGARVKLTDRYAKVLSVGRGKFKWIGRIGVVVSCGRDSVAILWEGRQSKDWLPIKAVELAG